MSNATEQQAEAAIKLLKQAIEAAENSNQAGENAVVRAAAALRAAAKPPPGWKLVPVEPNETMEYAIQIAVSEALAGHGYQDEAEVPDYVIVDVANAAHRAVINATPEPPRED